MEKTKEHSRERAIDSIRVYISQIHKAKGFIRFHELDPIKSDLEKLASEPLLNPKAKARDITIDVDSRGEVIRYLVQDINIDNNSVLREKYYSIKDLRVNFKK